MHVARAWVHSLAVRVAVISVACIRTSECVRTIDSIESILICHEFYSSIYLLAGVCIVLIWRTCPFGLWQCLQKCRSKQITVWYGARNHTYANAYPTANNTRTTTSVEETRPLQGLSSMSKRVIDDPSNYKLTMHIERMCCPENNRNFKSNFSEFEFLFKRWFRSRQKGLNWKRKHFRKGCDPAISKRQTHEHEQLATNTTEQAKRLSDVYDWA